MVTQGEPCEQCRTEHYLPSPRARLVASFDGPEFLKACTVCGTYWLERLHDARMVTAAEADELLARPDTVMATN